MSKKIVILQGHPDPEERHFGLALSDAYAAGAIESGHEVRVVQIGQLDFPLLRRKQDWDTGELPVSLRPAQEAIGWANHLALFFPLWLGGMPALTKGFLEQVARPGFALAPADADGRSQKLLKGRSARVVVTMGMPALVYRWYFRAHSLKALERNILGFVGIAPIQETLVGSVEGLSEPQRAQWQDKLAALGREGH